MQLYLIRHGQTIWNAAGRLQGSKDIELNEKGRKEAGELGRKLDNTKIDVMYSSPLIRAYETACLIRGHRDFKIIRDTRLREISFGVEDGAECSKWNAPDCPYRYFFSDPAKYVPPEKGESLIDVCARTKNFIKETIEPLWTKCERVVIVAHGALDSSIMCYLENRGVDEFWGNGLMHNCETIIYTFNGNKWTKDNNA